MPGIQKAEHDKVLSSATVFLQSRWWNPLSLWRGRPAGWCIGPRSGIAVPAELAPQTDSLHLPPVSHIPSPNGTAGIPLCPGTSSQLLDCWHSTLHRKLLATGSSQGSDKHRLHKHRQNCRVVTQCPMSSNQCLMSSMSYQLPLWCWRETEPVGLCAIN